MTDQTQWMKTMFDFTRNSFEAGMRSMDVFPRQAEKAMNLVIENANLAQDETHKMMQHWMENVGKARQMYKDTFEEGLHNLEQQFASKAQPKSK